MDFVCVLAAVTAGKYSVGSALCSQYEHSKQSESLVKEYRRSMRHGRHSSGFEFGPGRQAHLEQLPAVAEPPDVRAPVGSLLVPHREVADLQ